MSPTTHPLQAEEVMAYLDGELAPERAAAAAAHIEQCSECRAIAAGLRGVSRQMTEWQVESAPGRLEEGVLAAVKQHAEKPAKSAAARAEEKSNWWSAIRMRHLAWGLPVVAAMLFVFALSIPTLHRSRMAGTPTSTQTESRDEVSQYSRNRGDSASPNSTAAGKEMGAGTANLDRKKVLPSQGMPSGPMIARTAALSIETREFDNARAAMEKILRDHQGYIGQLTVSTPAGAARLLTVTLQVPAGQLNAVLAALKTLGKVQSENQTAEEVTRQYVDLTARLHNARETEERLITVLRERTGKVADVLEVEQEIARVRGEIEQMDAQRKNMESQVQFSSINLRLSEEYKAVLDDARPSTVVRLRNAVVEGFLVAYELVVGTLVVVLSAFPSLLLCVAVLFWPVRFAYRKLRSLLPRAA